VKHHYRDQTSVKAFLGCLGNGYCIMGTAMASTANQGLFAAMVAINIKFGLGDGGLVQLGLVLRGSGGPEPPASASGKS
jgi:hypothetical protein